MEDPRERGARCAYCVKLKLWICIFFYLLGGKHRPGEFLSSRSRPLGPHSLTHTGGARLQRNITYDVARATLTAAAVATRPQRTRDGGLVCGHQGVGLGRRYAVGASTGESKVSELFFGVLGNQVTCRWTGLPSTAAGWGTRLALRHGADRWQTPDVVAATALVP